MKKPKILIGLPTMGSVHTFLMVQILMWCTEAQQDGKYNISIYPTMSVQPVDNARNEIVETFLKSDCTHLFFIDSDTIPPPDALDKLLALDCDVASGITPIIELDQNRVNDSSGFYKRGNILGMDNELLKPDTGIQDMKAGGGSCLLIKRKVLEDLQKPIFRFVYKDSHPEGVSFNGSKDMMSEDYYFCAKALGKGFIMKCDTTLIAKHQKSVLW